jgi:hypothetical protein
VKTLKLKKPVKLGEKGEMITELKFRDEISGSDLRGILVKNLAAEMRTDDLLLLAERLSGQPSILFESTLCFEDVMAVMNTVGGFYMAGLGGSGASQ